MRVLIAPNAFKNSLSAGSAAEAIQKGLIRSNLTCSCECFPVADGGDGTGKLIVTACGGRMIACESTDALQRKITTEFGLIDKGETAVIEMAAASGISLLKSSELDPLRASSYGTGQLIKLALNRGVKKIIIGMGGSATVDGGCGILQALGFEFLDFEGKYLTCLPADLPRLYSIETTNADKRIFDCEILILCDVRNRLLGEQGSAAVFGPQKGAAPEMVKKLDRCLGRLADIVLKQTGKDMADVLFGGTAGGAAAGLFALLNAKLVSGADAFLEITGFEYRLKESDLVITGEGSIDEQTLNGKAPFVVAQMAKEKSIPVIALAGKVALVNSELNSYFQAVLPVTNAPGSLEDLIKHTAQNLERTALQLGNLLALKEVN